MRVLLTGGSSLIGRAVAPTLLARGDLVTCFQRSPSGVGTTDVLGDVSDPAAVLAAAAGHDAVIHLAALVAPRPGWDRAYRVNVVGSRNVVSAAARCGRLVHVSSPSVAFDGGPAVGAGAEPATYRGRDAYTRSKAVAERYVLEHTTVPTVVVRPHLVWGPGDTQLIGRIVERARQGRLVLPDHGRPLVDTTYVDDAADAIVAGLDRTADSDEATGKAWVVTGGDPRPLAELVEGILEAAGLDPRVRSVPAPVAALAGRAIGRMWPGGEPPLTHFAARQLSVAHWFDQSDTRRVLRWRPRVGVDRGMDELGRWFAGR
ncbi:MAG: NAD-dependent epimerase/dehydratase family protein [Acidimicrobiales bacterium]|jgi:nucleoside-diphosphate-sugar epimerase